MRLPSFLRPSRHRWAAEAASGLAPPLEGPEGKVSLLGGWAGGRREPSFPQPALEPLELPATGLSGPGERASGTPCHWVLGPGILLKQYVELPAT